MSKIKIAFLIDALASDKAGTEKQLVETIRRIDPNSFEPYLICLHSSRWLEQNKVPCHTFVLGYRGFLKINFFKVLMRLILLMRKHRFDILQTFFEESIFVAFLAVKASGVPCSLLSSRRDIGLGNTVPWYHALYKKILPMVNKGFDGIVANSRMVKEYVTEQERIPEHKVRVIYNAVDEPEFYSKPHVMAAASVDFWIVLLANLRPVKRIDVFLRSLPLLKASYPGIKFGAIVMGEGPERAKLEKLTHDLDLLKSVFFLGTVAEPGRYLQYADLAVLCSDREGCSNAILEYMSYALPVVASNVGGNSELVDGSNGVCVPPGDPEALCRAIGALVGDRPLRDDMGRRSLERVRSLYSWGKALVDLQGYYAQMAGKESSDGAGLRAGTRQRDDIRHTA